MRIFSTEQSVGIKVGSLPTILKKNYADKNACVIIYIIYYGYVGQNGGKYAFKKCTRCKRGNGRE